MSKPDKNHETRSPKSIKGMRFELETFVKFCGKTHIEDLQGENGRQTLVAYRNYLGNEKNQRDTVKNKLAAVVSFLKHNPAFPIVGMLKKDDWPDRKVTTPDPYTEEEITSMLSFATGDEALIIRAFRGTGMRNAELAHAEREDIDWVNKCIYVRRRKDKFGWRAKNNSAVRSIPLDD
jgi:integrase